ncbi:MAG TPA: ATP-binding protein, partial [Thermoanaerobaculia bacterium]|nr:ATP-binding protein [Thermoanaerobaculia bacterium]
VLAVVITRDITESKKREQQLAEQADALRESEERFRMLFESIEDGFCIVQVLFDETGKPADYRFLLANPAFAEQTGLVNAVGRTALEMIPDLERWWVETYGRVALTGEPERFENHSEPMGRWFDVHTFRVGNPANRQVAIFFKNITERKRAGSRERFLVELDDAVRPLSDPEDITRTYARLLGEHLRVDRCAYADVEADEDTFNLTGDYTHGVPSIVGRYRMSEFGEEALRLHRAGEPFVVEDVETHRPALGDLEAYRLTQIRAVVSVPLHKEGRFVAGMSVHQKVPRAWTRDEIDLVRLVANRCWESIERARVTRNLRESEERLRLALAIAGIGTFDIDLLTDAVVVNEAGRAIYGWAPDEPLTFAKVQGYFHPADREEVIRRVEAAFDPAGPGEFEVEQRIVRADGEVRWIRVRGRAEFETAGDGERRAVRCLGTYLDVTDQKEAERAREQLLAAERAARAEAERAGQIKDEFLATLSHELRTPLNAILGWSHILGRGKADAGTVAKGLAAIERNASSQAKLIEDLLDMSRIITGQIRLDTQNVELHEVIAAAVETVRPAAEAKEIHIQPALDPKAAPVRGDPNRLQQVVWNLLSNAVKFTPRGGKIRVALERVNSHAEVTVTDTGQGIEPEFLPFVFDRFRQADGSTTRQHGGLGLGLAIVRQLVELHGGRVRVKSPGKDQGATFIVELPLAAVPLEEPQPLHPVESLNGGDAHRAICEALSLDRVTVLAVDDDPDALAIIRHVLEECDARVLTAGSAAEALELLDRERPDVLLSDIGMPGMDGYELMRRVRALGPGAGGNVPAAALTAFASSEDRTRAALAGYQTHLAKPVRPAELLATVASLAGRTSG